jgi:hypothetical protein
MKYELSNLNTYQPTQTGLCAMKCKMAFSLCIQLPVLKLNGPTIHLLPPLSFFIWIPDRQSNGIEPSRQIVQNLNARTIQIPAVYLSDFQMFLVFRSPVFISSMYLLRFNYLGSIGKSNKWLPNSVTSSHASKASIVFKFCNNMKDLK